MTEKNLVKMSIQTKKTVQIISKTAVSKIRVQIKLTMRIVKMSLMKSKIIKTNRTKNKLINQKAKIVVHMIAKVAAS